MIKCRDCKWWGAYRRNCCDFPDTIPGDKAFSEGHGARINVEVWDDSGLTVDLETGPDFGCVNGEEK